MNSVLLSGFSFRPTWKFAIWYKSRWSSKGRSQTWDPVVPSTGFLTKLPTLIWEKTVPGLKSAEARRDVPLSTNPLPHLWLSPCLLQSMEKDKRQPKLSQSWQLSQVVQPFAHNSKYIWGHFLCAVQVYSVEFLRALGSQSGVSVWQHTLVG